MNAHRPSHLPKDPDRGGKRRQGVTDITPDGRAYLDEREPEQGEKKKFGF